MNDPKRFLNGALAAALLAFAACVHAGTPSAEKLLPDDTLALLTTPDFVKLGELSAKSPQAQLWNDPAMKPFKDKFLSKWNEELAQPLERELDVKLADYAALLRGQVTVALTRNGWNGGDNEKPGFVLLVDTKDRSGQLKTNLTTLKKKWVDAGKTLKTETIRDVELTVLPLSSNDVPRTLRRFYSKSSPVEQLGDDKQPEQVVKKDELVIGQADSVLVVANSVKAAEAVVVRLKGASMPCLAEFGPYQANHLAMFRDAPAYGWVNMKGIMDVLLPAWSEKKENPEAPNPFDIRPEKILNALGLAALKTVAFNFRQATEGGSFEIFLGVPEANRQGLLKILAGEPKEATPPPFVSADVLKFQRWRMDGKKAWATLEKSLGDISTKAVNTLNFLLDSANTYAREKDPAFDIRKNLIGNLGDDIITLEKRRPSGAANASASASGLVLLGSPNPQDFVAALKGILVFMSQQASTPAAEREFLGRKIYSVPFMVPGRPADASAKTPALYYGASSGYVALATDAAMIEEFFRTCDSPPKALRDLAGFADAAQKVIWMP
ncbi:MAG TPA: hypothetical protein VJA21_14550 [Verrucomicrobiae bacterium]